IFIQSLAPKGRVYEGILLKSSHEKNCSSSCYDCLRDYYNQQYHHLINWRIALDLAGLARNANFTLDFSQPHWTNYVEGQLLTMLEHKLQGKRKRSGKYYLIEAKDNIY